MIAPAFPIPSGVSVQVSWCPRERRAVGRSSQDYDLLAAIRGARARWMREHRALPPLALLGCRTVTPPMWWTR